MASRLGRPIGELLGFGLVLSAALHFGGIGGGLMSFRAPPPFEVQEIAVEADIATEEDLESGKGETKAELDPRPAPLPSERPETVPDAQNVGDANEDSQSREGIVNERTLDTVKTSAAPEAETVNNSPIISPDPVTDQSDESVPVPTNELASLNEPRTPIEEEAPDPADPPAEDSTLAPSIEAVPIPVRAPTNRPKPRSAQTNDRRIPEEVRRQNTATSREDQQEVSDRIGQFLNTAEDTAGGARREERVASLGAENDRVAPQLTRNEYDALKGRIGQCWSIPLFVDSANLRVVLDMEMTRGGELSEITNIAVSGVDNPAHVQAIKGSLTRNLQRGSCQFTDVLPEEKYETWRIVRVNFAPQDF